MEVNEMNDIQLTLTKKPKEESNSINWKECLCHTSGQTGELSKFTEQTWKTFQNAAEVRKDFVYEKLNNHWDSGPKGGYHRRCYQVYTCKRNLKYPLKRKLDNNVKMPVTGKPAKLPKTYDRSRCIICLEIKLLPDRKSHEQLCQCLTDDGVSSLKKAAANDCFLLKRLETGNDILYHKTCYKKLTRRLYKGNENLENVRGSEESAVYDRSFDILASEVEQKVLKQLKVVNMSDLKSRFCKILRNAGIETSNYKSLYLKNRLEKRFGDKLSFWRSNNNSPYIVFCDDVPKGQIIEAAIESIKQNSSTDMELSDLELVGVSTEEVMFDELHRNMYHTAKAIRNLILLEAKSSVPWPPTGSFINEHSVIIPILLYNLIALILIEDKSDLHCLGSKIKVSEATDRRVISIAQDIIYNVFHGKVKTPKHVGLAVLVKSLTGSAELIKILNRFGHSISYDLLEEAETAIAFNVAKRSERGDICMPSNVKRGVFSTFCWDNNDINEETLTGGGTTHCTNGIVIQKECDWCETKEESCGFKSDESKRRSFPHNTGQLLEFFTSGKRQGPSSSTGGQLMDDNFTQLDYSSLKKDFCFVLSRLSFDQSLFNFLDSEQCIPAWSGFNMMSCTAAIPRKDVIGYLQVIDASPTELSTVNSILDRSMFIADEIGQKDVVIVFDQAIYAKALEIIWARPNQFQRIILRMGAFHIACAFLAVIGKRFDAAGLSDLLVESGVIGSGSLTGVLDGKHYNRAMRLHKLVLEGLERCRWKSFGNWLESNIQSEFPDENMQMEVLDLLKNVRNVPCKENIQILYDSACIDQMLKSYMKYCGIDQGPNKKFWNSYIEMVRLLLTFIRATREGNWELHLASVRQFLPWFFAYDRQNYSRYLPVYWLQMTNLPESHPEANEYLSSGKFGVQRTAHSFSFSPVDQTIEQTLNRDTKTKGGIVGFSVNKGAVQRWILNAHERAAIINSCRSLAGIDNNDTTLAKELGKTRRQRDEADVTQISKTVEGWFNPFEPSDQLTALSSGVVAGNDIKTDLLTAKDKGTKASTEFIFDRLLNNKTPFYDPIPKKALKRFSAKTTTCKPDKNTIVKADRNLFARLLVIAQSRQLDMRDVLKYELGPIPWSIATTDGSLVKTNKATLSAIIEKKFRI